MRNECPCAPPPPKQKVSKFHPTGDQQEGERDMEELLLGSIFYCCQIGASQELQTQIKWLHFILDKHELETSLALCQSISWDLHMTFQKLLLGGQ